MRNRITIYDFRPPKFQNLDVGSILKLKHDLQDINPHIPFATMFLDHKSILPVMTIVGKVAKGSIIHK